jgi:hypothetical protein
LISAPYNMANFTAWDPQKEYNLTPRILSPVEAILPKDNWILTYNGFHQYFVHDQPWTIIAPLIAIPLYLWIVFGLPKLVKKEYSLKLPLALWNLFLCLFSLVVWICWWSSLGTEFVTSNYSIHHMVCHPTGQLTIGLNMACATVFAISKYLELIDTVFLVLRKRPVEFLHWYHHTTVLVYTWYCTMVLLPIGNIFGSVNAMVHTVMYGYYFLSSIGQRPWWGKYVTWLQLAQMVFGLLVTSTWAYFYLTGQNCLLWRQPTVYVSEDIILVASIIMYGSYFILFLRMYLKRFAAKPQTGANSKAQQKKNE